MVVSSTSKTFVSEFRGEEAVIWLMVNRDKLNDETVELSLNGLDSALEQQWFDLYHGMELDNMHNGTLKIFVEANGYGAILVTIPQGAPGMCIYIFHSLGYFKMFPP